MSFAAAAGGRVGGEHGSGGRLARGQLAGARGLLSHVPREAWVCALLACLNAVCWSLITPPFQLPDEPDHFAYVQQLADNGSLPGASEQQYSAEESTALNDLSFLGVRQHPGKDAPIATQREQQRLEGDLTGAAQSQTATDLNAGLAGGEPPLYYALETIPYALGSGGGLLERLQLMSLLSALMAGVTALFAFLFLREALPRVPWSWTVGGLGVALFPLLGFMSGGVTSEAMLYAVCAALFYCLARTYRRGLTRTTAIATGSVIAAGMLVKLNFLGLLPGTAVGLLVLTRRAERIDKRAARESLSTLVGIVAGAILFYAVINLISHRSLLGAISGGAKLTAKHGSIFGELSYIWQFYLPRLPGMHSDFAGLFTTRQIWFNGLVGLYGWLDTSFPEWVNELALLPMALIVVLCARELFVARTALRRRIAELSTYMLMAIGLLALVGADAYLEFPTEVGNYAEPRYLMPLLVFWGVALTLAVRGAGRRWGPMLGALLVVLALAHDIFSQLLLVGRFYG
jgi:hypothetical protein